LFENDFFAESVSNAHNRAKSALRLGLTHEGTVQNKVQIARCKLTFSINELAWLKLEKVGVFNDVFVSID